MINFIVSGDKLARLTNTERTMLYVVGFGLKHLFISIYCTCMVLEGKELVDYGISRLRRNCGI